MITEKRIQQLIQQGENVNIELKNAAVRAESLAREIVSLSNTLGGVILIGIEDNGEVTGITRENVEEWVANISRNNMIPSTQPTISQVTIDNKKIYHIPVEKGQHKPYQTTDGRFWVRVGSTNRQATKEELSRLFQEAGLVHYDISPVARTSRKSLDDQKLHDYFHTYYQLPFHELSAQEQEQILRNTDILQENDGELQCSVGGLLIFGKEPQRYLPQSNITFAVFKGKELTDELIDKKELKGTLPELIDQAAALAKVFIPVSSTVEGVKREEKQLISSKTLREAIVNAVCHRDYSLYQRRNQIYIFSNRIEIRSAGKLPNTLTLEKIKYGNSAARNPFLLQYLDNMRFIDGLGRGIPSIIKEMGDRAVWEEIGVTLSLSLYLKLE